MRTELRDSLENLYADSTVGARPCQHLQLDLARGGTAAVHVLVNDAPSGQALRVSVREHGRTIRGAAWFRLIAVPVEENTGLTGFTEGTKTLTVVPYDRVPNAPNPHVVRRAPFRAFDAMAPCDGAVRTDSPTLALRLQIPVPRKSRPGARAFAISVAVGTGQIELELAVRVYRAVIPAIGGDTLPYTNWFSYSNIASSHGLKMWSEPYWKMLGRYAALMAHGRQNAFWIPLDTVFSRTRLGPVLNRERLRRIVQLFTAAGLHYIEGGHVASRTGGKWEAETFDVAFGGRATSPEGNVVLGSICRQLLEEIERNGWRERWIQHATDEPIPSNAVDYRILVGMLRRHMPGFPILDATQDPKLAGSVDFWCPQVQEYQRDREAYEAHRLLGDRVWYYTCCYPGGPWLNRLLDQELLRPALIGWGGALYRLDGFLHWGLNHYREGMDPFTTSVLPNHGGGKNSLPAGDTHIVYPGPDGPWSSLRLEAHREGFEDFELLSQLRKRNPRRAARVIAMAILRFDHYVKDVKRFRAARRALLESLEVAE